MRDVCRADGDVCGRRYYAEWSTELNPAELRWPLVYFDLDATGVPMDEDTSGTVLGLVTIILACSAVFLGIEIIGRLQP